MKEHPLSGFFPWVSLLTGVLSLPLRYRLFSLADDRGLLPQFHIAGILSLLLLLITAGLTFWFLQEAAPSTAYRKRFPASLPAAIGTAVGGLGIGISAFMVPANGIFRLLIPAFGLLSIGALLYAAYCRLIGLRPNCFAHGFVAVFLVFRILITCQIWGTEPQVQSYLFPLLGSMFLLLSCFYRAETAAMTGDYRKHVFFGQMALYCCIASLTGEDWLFNLSAAVWLATDYCILCAPRYYR